MTFDDVRLHQILLCIACNCLGCTFFGCLLLVHPHSLRCRFSLEPFHSPSCVSSDWTPKGGSLSHSPSTATCFYRRYFSSPSCIVLTFQHREIWAIAAPSWLEAQRWNKRETWGPWEAFITRQPTATPQLSPALLHWVSYLGISANFSQDI